MSEVTARTKVRLFRNFFKETRLRLQSVIMELEPEEFDAAVFNNPYFSINEKFREIALEYMSAINYIQGRTITKELEELKRRTEAMDFFKLMDFIQDSYLGFLNVLDTLTDKNLQEKRMYEGYEWTVEQLLIKLVDKEIMLRGQIELLRDLYRYAMQQQTFNTREKPPADN